jgi:trk system potassium uptake protein TrkH
MQSITFRHKNNRLLSLAPTKIIVLSFAILVLTGTFLLMLPVSSRDGHSIGFVNALFTATSATCVTGLVVVDTYNYWTPFGQLVILGLIQAGGLGIVTLASFFSVLLGRKMSIRGMILAQESMNHFSFEGILKLIKRVIFVTIAIEMAGAILLSLKFIPMFGLKGLYFGVFHSISSFCNAGFDLMGALGKGDFVSLTYFNNEPLILYTIGLLIVTGGLGFVVWKDLYELRNRNGLLLHTKVVLIMTTTLIVFGAVFFFVFEYNNPNTLGRLNLLEKINASVFQSITPRTAGYNSLPLNDMNDISKFFTIVLMFIGAAPGSTAGGIKVTTFGIIIFAILSQIGGNEDTIILKRRVPHYIVNKSLAITGLSITLVLSMSTIILAIENKPFLNVLYEVTSAFGTVGLTTGITPTLHTISKILLSLTMFLGRVGPVTFAIALTLKSHKTTTDIIYPEGKIIVG